MEPPVTSPFDKTTNTITYIVGKATANTANPG
jgi:hypothetical protein